MKIELIWPENNMVIDLLREEHTLFIQQGGNRNDAQNTLDWLNLHKQGEDHSYPEPVYFKWKTDSENTGVQKYYLALAEEKDFTESNVYECESNEFCLSNLFIGKTYFWMVYIEENGKKTVCSEVYNFSTSPVPPRWIKAGGLSNVRDIGGWTTINGKKIRQGLVYRGCEMEFHHTITESGKDILINCLKIKTDLDLRQEAVGKIEGSALGNDVELVLIPAQAYDGFLTDEQTCKKIFTLFTDRNNYPFYIHCWGGADRTGTVVLLLCGILGMKKEDLFLDYELTSFSIWGERNVKSDLFKALLEKLDSYGGKEDSINQKCFNYLLKAGITKEDIYKIKEIMLMEDDAT